ncbi:hypothetical protein [Pontibacter beigongshangensis]|uniref:hypothetical protein n=1 Tax=Pontibacter beigongshangensis TaxID=2574733 RepID=UPI00164FF5A6|nr:hypothetical protein [Pontibacter beigongshangensis]
MERNNWNNRDRDFRHAHNSYEDSQEHSRRNNERRADPDTYRGAYRQDTTSDHRHVSTWNGFDRGPDNEWQGRNHRSAAHYQNRNRMGGDSDSTYQRGGHESYGRQREERFDSPAHRSHYRQQSFGPGSNFNNDYGPDNYQHRRDENYGNMAGSLSFGYDGDRNSDPDANRYYDPLSGRIRDNRYNRESQSRNARNRSDDSWYADRH